MKVVLDNPQPEDILQRGLGTLWYTSEQSLNNHNSVIFQSKTLILCMEIDLNRVYVKTNAMGRPFVCGPFLMFIFGPFPDF